MKLEDRPSSLIRHEARQCQLQIDALMKYVAYEKRKMHRLNEELRRRKEHAERPEPVYPTWDEITFETEYSVKVVDNDEQIR